MNQKYILLDKKLLGCFSESAVFTTLLWRKW